MEAPLVSIIVPTYNRPHFLNLTLESIEKQTFQNFEIIVIDDGSPTNEAQKICANFPKVSYLKIENSGGPSKPRNLGIKNAKGTYVAFIDDDDLWFATKLEKQVKILNENLEFGLVHGPCKVIDSFGNVSETIIGRPGSPDVKHGNVKMKMIGNWTLMMPTVLIRKEILNRVGYFNTKMPQAGEDLEYWSRCSFYTNFYYLDEPLALYREHYSNSKILKEKYIELPQHLKLVLKEALKNKQVQKKEFQILLNNLIRMQIKNMPNLFWKNIAFLFKLDFLWILKIGNWKLLLKKLAT